jgi:hypothetical protein
MFWHIIIRQVKTLSKQGRDTSQHLMMLAECVDALVLRLQQQQQQQQQLGKSHSSWQLPSMQQQQQGDDTDMYFTDGPDHPAAGCALPSSAAAAAAAAAERPSKRPCCMSGSSLLPAMLQQRSWPAEVVRQLEAEYLYHVVKQGRQQPLYDKQLLEEVVEQIAGLTLAWGQQEVAGHNRAMIAPQ